MNNTFLILTIALIVISVAMILIILVQRPQGGGLASAFGGAGGGSTDTVFGGRVGDALTVMTVVAFILFLGLAVSLNLIDSSAQSQDATTVSTSAIDSPDTTTTTPASTPPTSPASFDYPSGSSSPDQPTSGN